MSGHAAVSAYGRLTGDPRAIETRTGNPMTVGRLAVSLPCRENGEDGEAAAFFGLVAFSELAESLARHLKGDMVGAFGRVKINRYTNRDGEAREELQHHGRRPGIGPHRPARRRAQEAGDGGSPHPGPVAVRRTRPARTARTTRTRPGGTDYR